ncbi:hypothetical protein C8R46DRAFT_1085713 [Mycena filopes]|nr:hypothetical protein C8R46DRAFT_1085713 [Mycena filopes]
MAWIRARKSSAHQDKKLPAEWRANLKFKTWIKQQKPIAPAESSSRTCDFTGCDGGLVTKTEGYWLCGSCKETRKASKASKARDKSKPKDTMKMWFDKKQAQHAKEGDRPCFVHGCRDPTPVELDSKHPSCKRHKAAFDKWKKGGFKNMGDDLPKEYARRMNRPKTVSRRRLQSAMLRSSPSGRNCPGCGDQLDGRGRQNYYVRAPGMNHSVLLHKVCRNRIRMRLKRGEDAQAVHSASGAWEFYFPKESTSAISDTPTEFAVMATVERDLQFCWFLDIATQEYHTPTFGAHHWFRSHHEHTHLGEESRMTGLTSARTNNMYEVVRRLPGDDTAVRRELLRIIGADPEVPPQWGFLTQVLATFKTRMPVEFRATPPAFWPNRLHDELVLAYQAALEANGISLADGMVLHHDHNTGEAVGELLGKFNMWGGKAERMLRLAAMESWDGVEFEEYLRIYNRLAEAYADRLILAAKGPCTELGKFLQAVQDDAVAGPLARSLKINELDAAIKADPHLNKLRLAYYARIQVHKMSPRDVLWIVTNNRAKGRPNPNVYRPPNREVDGRRYGAIPPPIFSGNPGAAQLENDDEEDDDGDDEDGEGSEEDDEDDSFF